MTTRTARRAASLLLASLLGGCMSYGGFPRPEPVPALATGGTDHAFAIWQTTFFGGQEALHEALARRSPYGAGVHSPGPPEKGLYVVARIEPVEASPFALIGTQLSLWTLTAFPAWSTRDGYRVVFEVTRDGAPAGTFSYGMRRRTFIWLPLLPFVWVNAYTASEEEAFTAVADQFFIDARHLFVTEPAPG